MDERVNGGHVRDTEASGQIWSFRGYRLSPSEFNTAMIHFYRGEVSRANTWRTRLDSTTNWAVITTGAALSFAFSDANHSHAMIPLNTLLVGLFLLIEARRYRYYELWSYRIRLMETNFFAAMLAPPFQPSESWAQHLSQTLLHPKFQISFWEALGRRFRRNYQYIFLVLALAWLVKIGIHPVAISTLVEFFDRAGVGPIAGEIVLAIGLLFNALLFTIGWLTITLQAASGEVLPSEPLRGPRDLIDAAGQAAQAFFEGSPLRIHHRHPEQVAYIITSKGDEIGQRVLHQLGRGVTALAGKGLYTGEERDVLLCAIHPQQVSDLKRLVRDCDLRAFVIINPAQEVIGEGFQAPS
ncbi:MAG: DUF2270 domain-containing protein [Ardenticatenaceae bacterium]|nr:DUF2270 domain-containing protein [Ardenticatenaceae bacterium]